ncbi:helix-turn-helix domain-containing protein [Neolewinella persica]|uniref:helix-turn-helix domain-containing protein n=1 Tax=Neolewinella persica TaxID=70998 RepID=UPI000375C2CD|nr:helix-turn-helix transcriptional regulator [Neolewinella persica]
MNRYSVEKFPADVMREMADKHTVLRKQQGYSQADLAKRSGVSLGSLRRFEQTGKISLEHLLLLTHVLQRLRDFDLVLEAGEDLKEVGKLFTNKSKK